MNSFIGLHPIFANAIPADEPDPMQCILHDVFGQSLRDLEDKDAAERPRLRSRTTDDMHPRSQPTKACRSSSAPADMFAREGRQGSWQVIDDMSSTSREGLVPAPLFSRPTQPPRRSSTSSSRSSPSQRPSRTPSLSSDSSSSFYSDDSYDTYTPPRPLALSLISKVKPAAPILTRPIKKQVQFHPSHTIRTFSPHSYSFEFLDSSFTATHHQDREDCFTTQRRQHKLTHEIEESLSLHSDHHPNSKYSSLLHCKALFLTAQNDPNTPSPTHCSHQSVQSLHDTMASYMSSLHYSLESNLSSSDADDSPHHVVDASPHLTASLRRAKDYFTSWSSRNAEYIDSLTARQLATCGSTENLLRCKDLAAAAKGDVDEMVKQFWSDEKTYWERKREETQRELEEEWVRGWDCRSPRYQET